MEAVHSWLVVACFCFCCCCCCCCETLIITAVVSSMRSRERRLRLILLRFLGKYISEGLHMHLNQSVVRRGCSNSFSPVMKIGIAGVDQLEVRESVPQSMMMIFDDVRQSDGESFRFLWNSPLPPRRTYDSAFVLYVDGVNSFLGQGRPGSIIAGQHNDKSTVLYVSISLYATRVGCNTEYRSTVHFIPPSTGAVLYYYLPEGRCASNGRRKMRIDHRFLILNCTVQAIE